MRLYLQCKNLVYSTESRKSYNIELKKNEKQNGFSEFIKP